MMGVDEEKQNQLMYINDVDDLVPEGYLFLEYSTKNRFPIYLRKSATPSLSPYKTVGITLLPWAPYHCEQAGTKLHVALQAETQPLEDVETVGSRQDGPVSESLNQSSFILVMDRAYGKQERLDRYKIDGQSFVIATSPASSEPLNAVRKSAIES
ncbi:hypothetical protein SAMN03159341_1514 [Paenibacillus sp. 1_12]|uniref:hypothetical protein n=1 Tax=Paenibacillus sp. 1_12 TaxID=1566278 RepID=UPI0008E1821B|nr:hypothetical protein SAMN03159341_1514 [Paenibacillus sp. 1_12]